MSSVITQQSLADDYDVDKVDRMRLKVNRVNLVQTIQTDDDFLSQLRKVNLIDSQEFLNLLSKTNREERTRLLVDSLVNRKHSRKDWYLIFRSLLVQKHYIDLVTFLDNTIIKKPQFVKNFFQTRQMFTNRSHNIEFYSDSVSNLINNSEIDYNTRNKSSFTSQTQQISDLNESNFNSLAKKFPTYSIRPTKFFKDLDESKNPADHGQLGLENDAFDLIQKLELLYEFHKSLGNNTTMNFKHSNSNNLLFIFDTKTFKEILDPKRVHFYVKYLKNLVDLVKIDLIKYLNECLIQYLKVCGLENELELKNYVNRDDLVLKFVVFLIRNDRYDLADQLLNEYLINLKESKPESESNKLNALSYLILVKNNLFDFKKSIEIFDEANDILVKKEGKNNMNSSLLSFAVGSTYYELSKFDKAQEFFIKALKVNKYY
jgi:hypothetical protein